MRNGDVIIIGSGVAALQLARNINSDKNVILITKSDIGHGNSTLAQGGIAAAIDPCDHPFSHFNDTVIAGRSMNDNAATLKLTQEAPTIIQELAENGCAFDLNTDGTYKLGKEGAHTYNRIIHGGGDQTGKVIMNCLKTNLPAHITLFPYHFVFELLTTTNGQCCGVRSKDNSGEIHEFHAPHVVLATGGCGQIFSWTSNAANVTGDGMSLAYQAGAELVDMEFIQFHPTLLYINGRPKGLISEAVRGEGARLVDDQKRSIMKNVHPLEDLAPRHIVSQTIFERRQAGDEVYLDIRMIDDFSNKFPTITDLCQSNGLDLSEGWIPVAPGCHFSMGGVKTDDVGRTTLKGLYALGEVACTGVHGANRLASNSLLEGLVFGKRLGQYLNTCDPSSTEINHAIEKRAPFPFTLPSQTEIQERMMANVGIIRHEEHLTQHLQWLESFEIKRWDEFTFSMLTSEQMTTVFMLQTAWLITKSALEREESRGGHYRSDFPEEDIVWQNRQVVRKRMFEMGRFNEPIKT